MKDIVGLIENSMMTYAERNENEVITVAKIMTTCVLICYPISIYFYVVELTEFNVYETITFTFNLVSFFTNDFVNILLQFSFFSLCTQICSLLDQFEDEILTLNIKSDRKEMQEKFHSIIDVIKHSKIVLTCN